MGQGDRLHALGEPGPGDGRLDADRRLGASQGHLAGGGVPVLVRDGDGDGDAMRNGSPLRARWTPAASAAAWLGSNHAGRLVRLVTAVIDADPSVAGLAHTRLGAGTNRAVTPPGG